MKLGKGVKFKDSYADNIEKVIVKMFYDAIYKKIFAIIKNPLEVLNAINPVAEGINNGTLFYDDGVIKGKITAGVSKTLKALGAKFNKRRGGWVIAYNKLTPSMIRAITVQANAIHNMRLDVVEVIDNIDIKQIMADASLSDEYGKTLDAMVQDIEKTISIPVDFTKETKIVIAKEWADNTELFIQNFTEKNTLALRRKILDNTKVGLRAEALIDVIKKDFKLSKSKAKFLAKQETSLLTSKIREDSYKNAGITKYKWSTSGDERVRDSHKKLNGKIYSFDNPPIVDDEGNRKNPGEDFSCRCVPIPIIED